jgi:hypothetical protein
LSLNEQQEADPERTARRTHIRACLEMRAMGAIERVEKALFVSAEIRRKSKQLELIGRELLGTRQHFVRIHEAALLVQITSDFEIVQHIPRRRAE